MRVIVSQLTRMKAPRICIAGIQPTTGCHVRPTTGGSEQLTRALLAEEGGPLALGTLIEPGEVKPSPDPPETEDHLFRPRRIEVLGRLSANKYREVLASNARPSLRAIFGPALVRQGGTYAVEQGQGTASLGVLRSRRRAGLKINRYGRLRLRLPTAQGVASLPVTDLRLVEPDHETIRTDAVDDLNRRMNRGVEGLLLLGLSRAYRKDGDEHERHWLQVNGICTFDRPLGELP